MAHPSIVEVDYYALVEKMKTAFDARCLLERSDKERWRRYIDEHQVRESSLLAFGKVKFASGKPELVAIVMGSDWDGCYVYSKADEAALKYIWVE